MIAAQINLNVEFSLTIQAPGIAPRFLAWVEKNQAIDDMSGYPAIGQLNELQATGPFDIKRADIYQAGQWLVAIPKESFRPESRDAILYVHIFPNAPMQVFYRDFPKFLKALGVSKFEVQIPRYLECVKRAVEFLEKKEIDTGESPMLLSPP